MSAFMLRSRGLPPEVVTLVSDFEGGSAWAYVQRHGGTPSRCALRTWVIYRFDWTYGSPLLLVYRVINGERCWDQDRMLDVRGSYSQVQNS